MKNVIFDNIKIKHRTPKNLEFRCETIIFKFIINKLRMKKPKPIFLLIKNPNVRALGESQNNLSIFKSICYDIVCEKSKINSNNTWLQKSKQRYSDN